MRPSQKQITPEQLAFAQAHALVRIVDDEADLREALSFVLDMEGWKTISYPKSRSKPSRYSSENDVLIEKSVKYTDFFLLSIVYV